MRPIPSCPNYFATDDGKIVRSGRVLKETDNGHGYKRVFVSIDGVVATKYVHRLVAEAYYGEPKDWEQCRHLNGVRGDNRPANIRWSDRATNESDKLIHGTILSGDSAPWSKLTSTIVMEARRRAARGESVRSIAKEMGLNPATLTEAVTGAKWGRLAGAVDLTYRDRMFSDDEIRTIRAEYGITPRRELAERYGVAENTIFQIAKKKSYADII